MATAPLPVRGRSSAPWPVRRRPSTDRLWSGPLTALCVNTGLSNRREIPVDHLIPAGRRSRGAADLRSNASWRVGRCSCGSRRWRGVPERRAPRGRRRAPPKEALRSAALDRRSQPGRHIGGQPVVRHRVVGVDDRQRFRAVGSRRCCGNQPADNRRREYREPPVSRRPTRDECPFGCLSDNP